MAQIVGVVTDSSGARVPGAKITATGVNTGSSRDVLSNAEGYYTIPLLPPGGYRLTVEKEGFNPVQHAGITLEYYHLRCQLCHH